MLIGLEKTEEGFISSFPKKSFPKTIILVCRVQIYSEITNIAMLFQHSDMLFWISLNRECWADVNEAEI